MSDTMNGGVSVHPDATGPSSPRTVKRGLSPDEPRQGDRAGNTATSTTPDLSEFASLTKGQGAKCAFGPSLSTLTDTDRSALDAVLVDLSYQATAIVRWLARRDILTTKTTVARHRPRHGDPIECVTCRI